MSGITLRFAILTALAGAGIVGLLAADQPAPPKNTDRTVEVTGQIVRVLPDQIVIDTRDKRNVIVWLRPLSKFVQDGRTVQITDLKVGATITASFMVEGADTVAIVTSLTEPVTHGGQPADITSDTLIDGRVVRVLGSDQVLVRGNDGTEFPIFVDPTTVFALTGGRTGRLSDLQTGMPISVLFDMRDQRRIARRIMTFNALDGQVVRTIGQDQVVIRGADGRETAIFVDPKTRFRLTASGGAFTDLRPGTNVSVFFNTTNQRNMAHGFFMPARPQTTPAVPAKR
jgi:hypothetical protein